MGFIARKSDFIACDQQRHRHPACAPMQSDQPQSLERRLTELATGKISPFYLVSVPALTLQTYSKITNLQQHYIFGCDITYLVDYYIPVTILHSSCSITYLQHYYILDATLLICYNISYLLQHYRLAATLHICYSITYLVATLHTWWIITYRLQYYTIPAALHTCYTITYLMQHY